MSVDTRLNKQLTSLSIHNLSRRQRRPLFISRSQNTTRPTTKSFSAVEEFKKKNVSNLRRVLETLYFILCLSLFLWQLSINISRYRKHPVSTSTSINYTKKSFLPSITICNNNYRFSYMLSKLSKKNSTQNLTAESLTKFWKLYGIQRRLLSTDVPCDFFMQHRKANKCEDFHSYGEVTNETPLQTPLGQCVDMALKYPAHQRILGFAIKIENHLNFKQVYNESNKDYFNIHAHDKDILYMNNIFINARAPENIEIWLTYEKKEYARLNSPTNPCQSIKDFSKCWDDCVLKKLESKLDCKIPSIINSFLPMCSSWKNVEDVYKYIHQLHSTGEISNCGCTRPCKVVEYKLNRIEQMVLNENYSLMSVELENRFDILIQEHYVYPFSALVNDFAGLVGFFLGISLPGLIRIVEFCTVKMKIFLKNCKNRF